MKYLLIICCLVWSIHTNAQTFREDLYNTYKAFATSKNMYAEVEITGYEGSMKAQPYFTKNTIIFKKGEDLYYKMGEKEILFNKRYVIQVNHAKKRVICTERNGNKLDQSVLAGMPLVDSLLTKHDEVNLIDQSAGARHYQVKSTEGEVIQQDFYFNSKTGLADKVLYTYNPALYPNKNWLELDFKRTNLNPSFNQQQFSESQFIYKDAQGELQLRSKFKGFRLVVMPEQ